MANQIRGLRNGLTAMDEYTIINNYLDRLHQRMTMPAKVPPRGFAMGASPNGHIMMHLMSLE